MEESDSIDNEPVNVSSDNDHVDYSSDIEKSHKCPHPGCKAAFLRPSRLARHVRQHTGERPYKCDYEGCDKAYTNTSHLKRHSQTHNIVKQSFKCIKCSLTISNQHNLKRHYERVHADNGKFSCKECGLKFSKEQRYKEHEAAHNGVALYKCKICSKQFMMMNALKKHEKWHDDRKEYPCDVPDCSEVFFKWSLLRKHKKSKHVTEYKCSICEKVFLTKTHLKWHSIVHVDDRPVLPCPYEKCPRFYFFQRNLDHHVRSNHLGKKYRCDICDLDLSSKQKIAQHIKRIHILKQKKTPSKAKQRKRRDAGSVKKSMLAKLTGLDLPQVIEKDLLKRKTRIPDSREESVDDFEKRLENSEEISQVLIEKSNEAINVVNNLLISNLEEIQLTKEPNVDIENGEFQRPASNNNLLKTIYC